MLLCTCRRHGRPTLAELSSSLLVSLQANSAFDPSSHNLTVTSSATWLNFPQALGCNSLKGSVRENTPKDKRSVRPPVNILTFC